MTTGARKKWSSPSERERRTKGNIRIYFPEGMKPSEFRMRPTNPTIAYYWSEKYRKWGS